MRSPGSPAQRESEIIVKENGKPKRVMAIWTAFWAALCRFCAGDLAQPHAAAPRQADKQSSAPRSEVRCWAPWSPIGVSTVQWFGRASLGGLVIGRMMWAHIGEGCGMCLRLRGSRVRRREARRRAAEVRVSSDVRFRSSCRSEDSLECQCRFAVSKTSHVDQWWYGDKRIVGLLAPAHCLQCNVSWGCPSFCYTICIFFSILGWIVHLLHITFVPRNKQSQPTKL
jgi:hypothetical protein